MRGRFANASLVLFKDSKMCVIEILAFKIYFIRGFFLYLETLR